MMCNDFKNHLLLSKEPNVQHTLLNSVVLENIFKILISCVTTDDIKNIRMVCKEWLKSSQQLFKLKAVLRIGPPVCRIQTRQMSTEISCRILPYVPINLFLEMTSTNYGHSGSNFLDLFERPFKKMMLLDINFQEKISKQFDYVTSTCNANDNLWSYVESILSDLYSFGFTNCVFTEHAFYKLVAVKLRGIHNLRLHNNRFGIFGQSPLALYQNCTPTIHSLHIRDNAPMEMHTFLDSCRSLEEISYTNVYESVSLNDLVRGSNRGEVPSGVLKKLDTMRSRFWSLRINMNGISQLLEETNLSLEYLSMTLETIPMSFPFERQHFNPQTQEDVELILRPVLQKFRKSLQTLILFRPPVLNAIIRNDTIFPSYMWCLKELHLYGNFTSCFLFLRSTPRLEKLVMETDCLSKIDILKKLYYPGRRNQGRRWFSRYYNPNSQDLIQRTPSAFTFGLRLNCMKELHMLCTMSCETIRFFGNSMPNLKIFKGIITSSVWEGMCKYLPSLQEIGILRRSTISDREICGYNNDEAARNPTERSAYNITRFQNLRRFTYDSCCGECKVGNMSVLYGFLEMPVLIDVHIVASDNLGAKEENMLRDKILIVNIERIPSQQCSTDIRNCCKETQFILNVINAS